MFWLSIDEVDKMLDEGIEKWDSDSLPITKDILKAQLKKFWEWGNEVCIIHHRNDCRLWCKDCIKNIKKELGI